MAQPHKGDRELFATRLPLPVGDLVRAAAAQRGISMSEYLAQVVAAHHGRADLVPATQLKSRGELPLTG